jgi:glycine reductase complex component B subunit alpha and beta
MRLELGTFPVHGAFFGDKTSWADGILEIDRDEVLALARADANVTFAAVDLAQPGESARIVNVNDVVEPRIKVSGPGMVYPGVCGRPVTAVGRGQTHRLGGFGVIECVPRSSSAPGRTNQFAPRDQLSYRQQDFIDLSGPGAVRPYASLINLVLSLEVEPSLGFEDRHLATHGATLRVADHLARAVASLPPPEREVFDLSVRDPALPGIVFIPLLASMEFRVGPDSRVGTAVYGVTRLSAPWLLHPTELLDGAVSQGMSWPFVNNPLVLELARRHGKELNFLAVIVHRSNWGGQAEMELAAERDAQAAILLGAQGAIVTTNIRGRRFVDTVACIKACRAEGLQAVLLTEEEDSEDGAATPLLINDPAIVAAVSTGTGAVPQPFPPVARVLGARQVDPEWLGELPPIAGRYGAVHLQDYYGFGRQSSADF